jgi:hypothetical protein
MLYITVNNYGLKKIYSNNMLKNKASVNRDKDMAQILIGNGSNINSQDHSGLTQLILGNLFELILDSFM